MEPAFPKAEYDLRLAKVKASMEAAGLDSLVVTEPANMGWVTGYDGWSFYTPQCLLVALDLDEPVLIVRGETSDILSADVAARMLSMLRKGRLETVAAIGHAPTLDEGEAVRAIDGFLADIAAQPAAL